ncbi:hypothetical protein CBM2637_B140002 [Cupriavidus taiwanensis]|nr:hypothetical protein CBM2637_B140002 [Cupriavidus taiwanensis]SPA54666.1 protein of unknown function [Cupriavidus taiwanensis]
MQMNRVTVWWSCLLSNCLMNKGALRALVQQ